MREFAPKLDKNGNKAFSKNNNRKNRKNNFLFYTLFDTTEENVFFMKITLLIYQ